jgi:hypothetical protein
MCGAPRAQSAGDSEDAFMIRDWAFGLEHEVCKINQPGIGEREGGRLIS